jgi:hypothetical protein
MEKAFKTAIAVVVILSFFMLMASMVSFYFDFKDQSEVFINYATDIFVSATIGAYVSSVISNRKKS